MRLRSGVVVCVVAVGLTGCLGEGEMPDEGASFRIVVDQDKPEDALTQTYPRSSELEIVLSERDADKLGMSETRHSFVYRTTYAPEVALGLFLAPEGVPPAGPWFDDPIMLEHPDHEPFEALAAGYGVESAWNTQVDGYPNLNGG